MVEWSMPMNLEAESFRLNILVVYWDNMPSMRVTTEDHLRCFERYLPHYCYYLNIDGDHLPAWTHQIEFDLIVFHDLFFCGRWGGRSLFEKLCSKINFLKTSRAIKIAVPQDEFISADLLCEFIVAFGIEAVFSVAPVSEWPKIYREVDREKVKLYCVLTGYLDDATQVRIETIVAKNPQRTIEIGYRAGGRSWRQAAWLGRHGVLKIEIADRFERAAPKFGIETDISTRSSDTFMGDAWYEFMARIKYTIGLEGGASVLDWDGSVRVKTLSYVEQHPDATFEEIESECFPGLDGQFALFALSPRHLEACGTRTCQILIEGDYNGVLKPWKHYLPLNRDFSNIDEILRIVQEDSQRQTIIEAAYSDIVSSGRYTYRGFAEFLIQQAVRIDPSRLDSPHGSAAGAEVKFRYYRQETNQRIGAHDKERPVTLDRKVARFSAVQRVLKFVKKKWEEG
jgi:hypothetical protein